MSGWSRLTTLLRSRRRAAERDMQDELEALRAIAGPRELGNLTIAAENARETWTVLWLARLVQDVRYALRSIRRNLAFTALAVLSLALGIGANTAIYSFTESILLRSLPVADPASLVVMKWRGGRDSLVHAKGITFSTSGTRVEADGARIYTQFPFPALEIFQRNTDVLSSAFCYFVDARLNVTASDETETLKGHYVSGDYFRGMGIAPAAGRLIAGDDDRPGAEIVVVLSHRFSRTRFGTIDRSVGQTIRVNNRPAVVIGVAPAGFFGAEPGYVPDVYLPIRTKALLDSSTNESYYYNEPGYYWIEVMGRLKPGVERPRAEAVLAPQFREFLNTLAPENQRRDLGQLRIEDGAGGLDSLRLRYQKPVYVLLGMVALILLIACANVANLLLARGVARRREIAVRLSIGASRVRIIRQFLTESLLLSSTAGALGVAFAWWGIRLLTLMLANGRENFTLHAELNANVLIVTVLVSLLTGVLFGLAPAFQATRADVLPALKDARIGTPVDAGRRRWGRIGLSGALVVAQIALSLVLVVAAGLFGNTLSNLQAIELGFDRERVLLFSIKPTAAGYPDAALNRLYLDVRDRLRGTPGVQAVSLSPRPLPSGGGTMIVVREAATPPAPSEQRGINAGIFSVGPEFFTTMRIPLKAGREFTDRDVSGTAPVAMVNEKLARLLNLPNPIGSRIRVPRSDTLEIVGVVGDALFMRLKDELPPMVYLPYLQGGAQGLMTFEIRAAADPASLGQTVRQIVRQMDSRLAVFDVKTQTMHVDQAISQEIALARLCTAFAALALVIACVGLYGTVAFNVTRRTGEIGIRMALGAQRSRILWLFLRNVLALEVLGLLVGIPIVLAGSRFVASLMYGVRPNDPLPIVVAVMVLLAAGLAASYLPARRASSIDPIAAVRCE